MDPVTNRLFGNGGDWHQAIYGSFELCERTFPTPTLKTATETTRFTSTPDWANYDILNNDGSAYLFASEPIPIYW